MGRLDGKVVLVTGGATGIGGAITRLFAAEGARVAFCGRSGERGKALEATVRDEGGHAHFAVCDVRSEDAVIAWVDEVVDREGTLDVVVNNAGMTYVGPIDAMTLGEWRDVLDTNVTSAFLVLRAVIPHLRNGGGGAIVNVGSTFGGVGAKWSAAYAMTKAAMMSLSQSLALELAGDNIRVNALCPGGTETALAQSWLDGSGDPVGSRAWLVGHHPLGRLADPAEQAAAALFLVSDDASFVTGHSLFVDGGYTAQ
jgi:NAD(P)-dependent dehydrogenase (short-subunit alcohol dehydrogenase family)